jgi:guanylate kinase
MNRTVVTITGPSASGKSVLEAALYKPPGSIFDRVISHTTRAPRAGEVDGVHYHFVTRERFEQLRAERKLINVTVHGTNLYGSHVDEFERIFAQQKIAILVCDPEGKNTVEKHADTVGWLSMSVFVTNPPSVRYERLLNRFIDDIAQLELGGEAFQQRKQQFAERLAITSEVESAWCDDAWQYDIQIDAFNEKNTTAVLTLVSAEALNRAMRGPVVSMNAWANARRMTRSQK